jgi:hypothetical protein
VLAVTCGAAAASYNDSQEQPSFSMEIIMGKTLHDRIRLKSRYALPPLNGVYVAALGAVATFCVLMLVLKTIE